MGGMGGNYQAVLSGGETRASTHQDRKHARMYLLQCWFSLSDEGVEDAINHMTVASKLLREDDEVVYGDSAYLGLEKREEIKNIVISLEKHLKERYNTGMSYPVKYRERTIEYREEGHTLEETSKTFKVAVSTIRKWEKQLKEKGDLKPKVPVRGSKKIEPDKLRAYVAEHPDAYQTEIAKEFNCCQSAVP